IDAACSCGPDPSRDLSIGGNNVDRSRLAAQPARAPMAALILAGGDLAVRYHNDAFRRRADDGRRRQLPRFRPALFLLQRRPPAPPPSNASPQNLARLLATPPAGSGQQNRPVRPRPRYPASAPELPLPACALLSNAHPQS